MMDKLFYFVPPLGSISEFLELGGTVLLIIAGLLVVMWSLILERFLYLRGAFQESSKQVQAEWQSRKDRASWHAQAIRGRLISELGQQLDKNMALIKTCIALCPLLGLLGTVTGMIEVFDVMALSGSGNARSMAAGVSKATVPTMAGMVAALSGVAMHAWLTKKVVLARQNLAAHVMIDH